MNDKNKKHNRVKKSVAAVLAAVILTQSIPMTTLPVLAAEQVDAQWSEIANIINTFADKAKWTTPVYNEAYTNTMPSTAILGNGNTGITSAGSETEKTYLISDSGFWSDNTKIFGYRGRSPSVITGGGLTISAGVEKHEFNIAYNSKVTASSQQVAFNASRTVSGAFTYDPEGTRKTFTGWQAQDTGAQHLVFDLGYEESFDRYVIKHDNLTSKKGAQRNTDSFQVQILKEGVKIDEASADDWQTIDTVSDNTSDTTDKKLESPCTARYVKLLVTKPTTDQGDNIARISQFELYSGNYSFSMPITDNKPLSLTYQKDVTATSGTDTAQLAVNGLYEYTDSTKNTKFEGWVSDIGQSHTLTVDLGKVTEFNRWTVRHNNFTAKNGENLNTSDYALEISIDNKSWRKIDFVEGNTADMTDLKLYYVCKARYARLVITKPSQESPSVGRARISQFELHYDNNYAESIATEQLGATVQTSSDPYKNKSNIIDNTWIKKSGSGYNDYSGWISVHANMPQNFVIDLGSKKVFDEWAVVHAGNELLLADLAATGNPNADKHANFPTGYRRFNTQDFTISYSIDNVNWTPLSSYEKNSLGFSAEKLETQLEARYIKVNITKGEQNKGTSNSPDKDQRARIAKFYLFDNTQSEFFIMPLEEYPQSAEKKTRAATAANTTGEFLEKLDIAKADINTSMTLGDAPVSMNAWLSPTQDILVTTVTSHSDKSQSVNIDVFGKNKIEKDGEAPASIINNAATQGLSGTKDDTVWASRTSNIADEIATGGGVLNKAKWLSELAMASKIIGGEKARTSSNENTGTISLTIPAGESITIITAIHCAENQKVTAANGEAGLAVTTALSKLDAIKSINDVKTLRAEQLKWWEDYYKLSYADFGDADLNRLYYGSQYIFACSTREGQTAPGLYGVWATKDNMAWQGDYHLNYNFQSPYYGSYSSNRLKQFSQPMYEIILRNTEKGKISAADPESLKSIESKWYWDTRTDLADGMRDAVIYPVGITQYDMTFGNNYLNQTMNALFCATQIMSYYRYTLDDDWLHKKIATPEGNGYSPYEYLVLVANFYEQWIEKRGARVDKEYIKDSPSWPDGHSLTTKHSRNYTEKYPQYTSDMGDNYAYVLYDGAQEGSFDFNPSVIIGNLHNLLNTLLEMGETKAPSAEKYAVWKDISKHLVTPEVTIFKRNGKEIFGLSEDRGIRPISAPVNLEFIHPGEYLSFDSDPYLLEVARNSIDQANWTSVNSTPKISTMAARVQYPENSLISKIKSTVVNKMEPNFYVDDDTHGWEKVGVVEALNNMMVQSSNGIIKVFPVWLKDKNGKFSTIREKGAFLVSSEMKETEVQYIKLTSEKGIQAQIVSPWNYAKVTNSAGKDIVHTYGSTVNTNEKTIVFDTTQGESYKITKGEAPKLEGLSPALTASDGKIILGAMVSAEGDNFMYKTTATTDAENKPEYDSEDLTGWDAFTTDTEIIGENGTEIFVQVIKANSGKIKAWGEASAVPTIAAYNITVINGSANKADATAGEEVIATATAPQAGMQFSHWTAEGIVLTEAQSKTTPLTFVMPENEVTLTATCVEIPVVKYTVSIAENIVNGTVTASAAQSSEGEVVTLIVTPSTGYKLKENSLTYKGSGEAIVVSGSTFTMPAEDVIVTAEFEALSADSYAITVNSGAHGSVLASHTQAMVGEEITLTITPNEGYKLVENSLTINGGAIMLTQENKFAMPAENVVITAAFEIIANKTPLASKIAEAKSIAADEYTAESFAALQAAIGNANTAMNEVTTNEEVAAATNALQAAINQLVKKSAPAPVPTPTPTPVPTPTQEPEGDKSTLVARLAVAKAIARGNYTNASWTVLQNIIANADACLNRFASVAEVQSHLVALDSAIAGLRATAAPAPKENQEQKIQADEAGNGSAVVGKDVTNVKEPRLSIVIVPLTDDKAKKLMDKTEKEILQIMDINLFSDGVKVTQVEGGMITITIPFDGEEGQKYIVLRYNEDNTISELEATYSNGELTFTTNHFSLYAIALKADTAQEASTKEESTDSSKPQSTLENEPVSNDAEGNTNSKGVVVGIAIALAIILILGSAIIVIKKTRKQ